MKRINATLRVLLAATLLGSAASAQTLVPKWANTIVFGASQIYVNGGAFNPVTSNLIVCVSSPNAIDICRPSDGAITGTLSLSGVSGGTYATCGLAIDTNGVIYACNYAGAGATKLYSWASESAAPVNFATSTLGVGSMGKTLAVFGSGNNAVFIVSSSSTAAIYVYYNGTAWTSKQLTVSSGTAQAGMSIISWSSTNCVFVTKTSGINGEYNSFNPSSASPITVSQVAYTSVPMAFVTLSGTTTPVQGAGGYDPTTALYAFHTRALTASPYTISNYLVATFNSNGLAAPTGCSPVLSATATSGSGVDSSNYGADFWGNRVLYCIPCSAGANYGFRAFDISAYKMADIAPGAQTNAPGTSATFSVVSGGSGALSYVWQLDGVTITNGGDYTNATTATLTISPVNPADAGTYTCTVTGAGGLSWTSSGGVLAVSQLPSTNTLALTVGSNPSSFGDTLTFTATISSSGATAPTGPVVFEDDSTPLWTNTLSGTGSTASATWTVSNLAPGNHSLTAVYGGDDNYLGSTSSALAQTVNSPASTNTLTLTLGGNPSTYGDALTFTATVSGGGAATPSGAVIFEDGSLPVWTNTLSGSGTTAATTWAANNLTAGTHPITAVYAGDANYLGSTSSVANQVVNPLPVILAGTRAYDGTATAASGILMVSNALANDNVFVASGSANLAGASVGKQAIASPGTLALGGAAAGNYTLAGCSGVVSITNPNTPFSITAEYFDDTGTNFVLVWESTPGVVYQVMGSTNLSAWTSVGGPVTATAATATNAVPLGSYPAYSFFEVFAQ
jgi:hypothetical protein